VRACGGVSFTLDCHLSAPSSLFQKIAFGNLQFKMVDIKINSIAKKTLGSGGHFMTYYTKGPMPRTARFQHFALLQLEKEKEETV